ncbi:MAG: hypothetical protein ACOYXR_00380 [Nitrospirota bacterium]
MERMLADREFREDLIDLASLDQQVKERSHLLDDSLAHRPRKTR